MPWRNDRIPTKPRLSVVPKFHRGYRLQTGVFCLATDDTILGTNALTPTLTLKLTESWGKNANLRPHRQFKQYVLQISTKRKEIRVKCVLIAWETADISRRDHRFSRQMTSEHRLQKFHTDYASLYSASDWSCHERNLLRPIRSITQIWVVNVNGVKFLQSLLRRHFSGRAVVASWNASLRGRRLEIVGERENGRARGRHACLHLARPFFLVPTTSKRLLRRLWNASWFFRLVYR